MRPIPLIATLAAALSAATVADAKEFRSSDVHPMDYPTVQAVVFMGKIIGEKTGGKYGVKVFGQSALGSEKDTIEQTKIGALDMVRVNVAPFNNIVPSTIVPSLPFLFKSTAHMRKVLDGPVGAEILAAMESQGFVGLCFYDSGSRSFYSGKKAIKSVADTKGMKIRVQQSDMWVAMMQAMGANAWRSAHNPPATALLDLAAKLKRSGRDRRQHLVGCNIALIFEKTSGLAVDDDVDRCSNGVRQRLKHSGQTRSVYSRSVRLPARARRWRRTPRSAMHGQPRA